MIPRCKIYRVTRRRKASTGSESLALTVDESCLLKISETPEM